MKNIILIICLMASSLYMAGQCTVDRFCLSFGNPQVVMGGSHFEFDLIVSSNSDFGLGTSNLQFNYNNAALATPTIVSSSIGAPLYQVPSITTPFIPALGQMVGSFNLELNTQGTGINIPTSGTVVCRLRFSIVDPNMSSSLSWYYNGGTAQTVVFDHNESTQLCAVDPGITCLEPSSIILPLELIAFETSIREKSIVLDWETKSEFNASHFEIQRSEDDKNFSKIEKMEATNALGGSEYQYEDTEVTAGRLYFYRLKMVDFDGEFHLSDVISGIIPQKEIKIEVFPNPVSKNESVFIKVNKPNRYNFILMDAKQSRVMSTQFQNDTELNIEHLESGIYFYQIEYDGQVKSGKLVVN